MSAISPKNCKVYYRKETSFCEGGTGEFKAFDLTDQLTEDFEIGVPEKLSAMKNAIGRGKYPTVLIEGGYKPGEQSVSFDLLTGLFFYYALGSDTVTGENPPYTHTIASSDSSLPSFEMFIKFPFTTDYMYHLKGVKVKSLEVTAEVGEETPIKATAELIIGKIETTVTSQTIPALSLRRFTFPDATISISYNSENISSNTVLNKFTLKIENEIEYKNQIGTEYPIRCLEGPRKITLSADQMIRTSTIYTLAQTYYRDYTTPITGSFQLVRAINTDTISISLSDIILKPMKHKFPSWESKELMQELQFEQGPSFDMTVTVKDAIASY